MMTTDPVADLLTRIRNAGIARLESCEVPASYLKVEILKILKREGYITSFSIHEDRFPSAITVYLRYARGRENAIEGIRRMSRPGRRWYVRADRIPRIRDGLGVAVVSTSRGLMSDREARKNKVGGELLFEVW